MNTKIKQRWRSAWLYCVQLGGSLSSLYSFCIYFELVFFPPPAVRALYILSLRHTGCLSFWFPWDLPGLSRHSVHLWRAVFPCENLTCHQLWTYHNYILRWRTADYEVQWTDDYPTNKRNETAQRYPRWNVLHWWKWFKEGKYHIYTTNVK